MNAFGAKDGFFCTILVQVFVSLHIFLLLSLPLITSATAPMPASRHVTLITLYSASTAQVGMINAGLRRFNRFLNEVTVCIYTTTTQRKGINVVFWLNWHQCDEIVY